MAVRYREMASSKPGGSSAHCANSQCYRLEQSWGPASWPANLAEENWQITQGELACENSSALVGTGGAIPYPKKSLKGRSSSSIVHALGS